MRSINLKGKFFLCMVVIIILLTVLSACGIETNTPSKQSEQFATGDKAIGEALEEVIITFYFPGEEKKDTHLVLGEIEKATRDILNVKLDFNWVPFADFQNKLMVMASAGDQYEANFDADWFMFTNMSQMGAYKDISSLFPEYAPNYYSKYDQSTLEACSVNGELLAIPWNYPKSERKVAVVRDDFMKKYNIPEIETIEDYEFYLKTVKENEEGIAPSIIHSTHGTKFIYHIRNGYAELDANLRLYYKWDDPEMKVVAWEQTPEYRESVETMKRWYDNEYIPKDILMIKDTLEQYFISGKAASFVHIFDDYAAKVESVHPEWEVGVYPLDVDQIAHLAPPLNNAICFSANGDQTERALMFIEWIHESQENYDLFMNGIRGIHYTLDGETLVQPAGMEGEYNTYMDWQGKWCLQNIEFERDRANQTPGYMDAYMKNVELNTKLYPHTGFTVNLESMKTEMAQRTSLFESMGKPLEYGMLPLEQIDEYIQKQKEAGTDKIVEEVQRQLDAWRASR